MYCITLLLLNSNFHILVLGWAINSSGEFEIHVCKWHSNMFMRDRVNN